MQTFQSVHLSSDIYFFLIHLPLSEYAYRWGEMPPGGRLAPPIGRDAPFNRKKIIIEYLI